MTVRQPIAKLQKMPQHLHVMPQEHDTESHVLSGQVSSVRLWIKEEERVNIPPYASSQYVQTFESEPARCVVLRY